MGGIDLLAAKGFDGLLGEVTACDGRIQRNENFSGFSSKRVLFNAVDPNTANKHAEISLWPGSIPALRME